MKTILVIIMLFFATMIPKVIGQTKQRPLTEADYKRWSTMEVQQLSEAGNWVSYSLQYESGSDTLFVKHTKSLKTYAFPCGSKGQFAKEHFFACQKANGQVVVTDLKTGKQETLNKVSAYTISREGQFLIAQRQAAAEKQELLIRNWQTKQDTILSNVSTYSYNPKANAVVFDANGQLLIVSLTSAFKTQIINANTQGTYSDIVWQKNGEAIAYFTKDTITKMGYYQVKEKKNYSFNPLLWDNVPPKSELYNASSFEVTIADDGSKVFFGVQPNQEPKDTTGVQIWNTADKSTYPERRIIKGYTAVPKVGVWFPKTNSFRMVTTTEFPCLILTGDQKKGLLFNPLSNEPQFNRNAPIDFYLSDVETGKQKRILERQSADEFKLSVSASGRYVAYFKDKNWWIYDSVKEEHRNVTKQIGVAFERENYDWSGEADACGIAGWTMGDKELLIYDNYDVWVVKTDGSKYYRLTKGREDKLVYRIVPQSENNGSSTKYNGLQKGTYNLSEGLLLQAKGSAKSGYCSWDSKKGLQEIVGTTNQVSNLKRSQQNEVVVFIQEHYHHAPELVVKFRNNGDVKSLFQSNPQQKNFQWGFSKRITYFNSKGQELHGALFYPAGYSAEKTYPMVVHIYERLSEAYNQYVNPSLRNGDGFNISNLTAQGYFVLLPDIVYEEGDTGRCAVDCVVNAVNEVLANEAVDPKRIGLCGHSFGGYETNFIITQTNIFAAAISSAGVSNVVSDYLYMGWNISKSNFWRYELNQMRIGVSLFDNYERYVKNAPITYAKQVQTPVLLWSGEEDKQVHYYQSIEFHLALRRLQKPNILVLYEGERHNIRSLNHQIDLTHRVQEWWEYYLKKGKRPEWFEKDKL